MLAVPRFEPGRTLELVSCKHAEELLSLRAGVDLDDETGTSTPPELNLEKNPRMVCCLPVDRRPDFLRDPGVLAGVWTGTPDCGAMASTSLNQDGGSKQS